VVWECLLADLMVTHQHPSSVAYFAKNASAFQLQFGKLYTLYSVKKVFLSAVAIFTLGSLVCAAAPTSDALIIGRAIAGMGCAGIYSGALIIISSAVPL
jgi:MFS family permease